MMVYDNVHPSGMRFCILANEGELEALRIVMEDARTAVKEIKGKNAEDIQILHLFESIVTKLNNPIVKPQKKGEENGSPQK